MKLIDKVRLFLKGYRWIKTDYFFIVWDKRTGKPINWKLPSAENLPNQIQE
ncbi:MAG: hypothetical protein J6S85_19835 [Methanobrevibacter sp.]|nr:hypothetical protein [Methanobrevibacter sp.]